VEQPQEEVGDAVLWKELTDLEPDLIEVESWVRTLDPDSPRVMKQIEDRLCPLVGWHREIPGVEIVPFDGPWPSVRNEREHNRISGNNRRKWHFFRKLQLPARLLYTSEAWNCSLHHLGLVLRARRRELEKSSRTGQGEKHNEETCTMHDSDFASTGIMTVADLRKLLRRLPGTAEVCFKFGGYYPAAITDFEYRKPENPDEGEVGVVLLSPDPAGEIGRRLSEPQGEEK
jgi:hypothetical protein